MPDCYEFGFAPLNVTDPGECAQNRMKLYLVAPQLTDELIVTLANQGPDRLGVSLHRVEGSMGNGFDAKPGSALGTVVLKEGRPTTFLLGGALLPNEIGAKEATALKMTEAR